MTAITSELYRLQLLNQNCGGTASLTNKDGNGDGADADPEAGAEPPVDTSKMSPYEKSQYQIAMDMKRTRDKISELESLPPGTAVDRRARLANMIRRDVQTMTTQAKSLRPQAMNEGRKEEYLQLITHVNKTERLSKGRKGGDDDDVDSESATGGGGGVERMSRNEWDQMGNNQGGPREEAGPSLRDDPEFAQFYEQTKKNDELIDQHLDRIGAGVTRLKENALGIKEELQVQETLLDKADEKVDSTYVKLRGLNADMKKALKLVDMSRLVVYGVCCLIVLGLAAACYFIIKTHA